MPRNPHSPWNARAPALLLAAWASACHSQGQNAPPRPGVPTVTEPSPHTVAPLPRVAWEFDCRDAKPVTWELEEVDSLEMFYSSSLAAAHTTDTNQDGLLDGRDRLTLLAAGWEEAGLFDLAAGGLPALLPMDHQPHTIPFQMGDLDGRPGAEALVAPDWSPSPKRLYLLRPGEVVALFDYDEGPSHDPVDLQLADLDGDGSLDVLTSSDSRVEVADLATGTTRTLLRLREAIWLIDFALADLDRDGVPELLGADGATVGLGGDLGIVDDDGFVPNPCHTTTDEVRVAYAVGNLDDDPDGEFVLSADYLVAVCDTDGTPLHTLVTDSHSPYSVAIGNLVGDERPEIVVNADAGVQSGSPRLRVYDVDLNLLTELGPEGWVSQPGFSLADLDADGYHEIVYATHRGLEIASGDGTLLANWEGEEGVIHIAPYATPIVVDLDGDGLSEIVAPRSDGLHVLSTPDGGFPAAGGGRGWSGNGHYPGKLALDGSVDRTLTPWLEPGGNAWNAHPVCQ